MGEFVELTFDDFDITGSERCEQDHVTISLPSKLADKENDGVNTRENEGFEGRRYCGTRHPSKFKSRSNEIILRFVSNSKGSCRGFNASFITREGKTD